GDSSSRLLQLRPVSFFYKPQFDDGSHLPQYGLIAEEVAKVYPEMVAYDNHGEILSIKYQLLAPMLLNELQKQAQQNLQQARQLRSLEDRLAALEGATAAGPQPVH
ncbi:MAG TPA: tail fiber domain-containing protein, partial [Bryobacteraceae bacterium]|nr:tail fiber domain-containing protein [Bryobacteraceae bacterium]